MQVVYLANSSNQIYQTVQLLNFDRFNDSLRPFLQQIFKFISLPVEVGAQLFKLLSVACLLLVEPLRKDLVQVCLSLRPSILLCRNELSQFLADLQRA